MIRLNELSYEALLDAAVQKRLKTDHAYLYAENAEEQSEAEARIEREEDERLRRDIEVYPL